MSFNRRSFLTGVATAALSSSAMGAPIPLRARWAGVAGPPPSIPSVAPSASWSGAVTSPAGAPTYPSRGNAQPNLTWLQTSQIRSNGLTTCAVFADAFYATPNTNNGISYVDFWVGGTTQRVTTMTQYTYTDVNGVSRTLPAFVINLDCAAAHAAHANGVFRVYATAQPMDGTMNQTTIGPLTVYSCATVYDFDVTVNSGGGATYTSLSTAMAAMKTALAGGSKCGRVTITGGTTYEWGSPVDFNFPWSYGMSCVTVASGVTATIFRGSSFSTTRSGSGTIADAWCMYSYVQNLEFRGVSGGTLKIDKRNFRDLRCANGNSIPENLHFIDGSQLQTGWFLFNGITVTNSEGTYAQTYFNGGPCPPLAVNEFNGNTVIGWSQSCFVEYMFSGAGFTNWGLFNQVNLAFGTPHESSTKLIWGEFYANATIANEVFYTNTRKIFDVTYSGAATTASIDFDGNATITVKENGATVLTFVTINPALYGIVTPSGSNDYSFASQIAAVINARTGWSVTNIDDTFNAYQIRDAGAFSRNTKSTVASVYSKYDIHSEWLHLTTTAVQVVVCNNTVRNCGFGTAWFNNQTTAGGAYDMCVRNNAMDTAGGAMGSTGTYPFGHHVRFENNTVQDTFNIITGYSDAYSRVTQNIVPQMLPVTSYGDLVPNNNLAGGSPPSGVGNVSLGTVSDATWAAYFVNRTNGNYTPAGGSALALNAFAILNPYDGLNQARTANDAVGAWKIGGTAPTWPF